MIHPTFASRFHSTLALLSSLSLVGCAASSPPSAVKSPFPTRAELDAIAKSPVTTKVGRKVATPSAWTVDLTTEPAAFPSATLEGKWQARAGDRQLAFAPELRCVARELARFYAEHGAEPDERLNRLVVRGCGFTSPSMMSSTLTLPDVPAAATDAEVVDALVTPEKVSFPLLYRGAQAGIAIVRHEKRAVLVLALGRTAEPSTFSAPDAAGKVLVTTRLTGENASAMAYINQGAVGVRACDPQKGTAGTVAWSCAMAQADAAAWIEVMAAQKGLVLARPVAQALARRDPTAPLEYKPSSASPRPVTQPETFVSAVLDVVNERRASARLPPLTLAEQETKGDCARLAPHYFQAELVADTGKANQVALGLMAGWEVEGTIRSGGFFGYLLSGTTDASQWLESALEMPSSRISLFDKSSTKIAIGTSPPQTLGGLGAVVTTYSFFDNPDHSAEANVLFARIAKARAERGLPPPSRMPRTEALAASALHLARNETSPKEALTRPSEGRTSERERRSSGASSGPRGSRMRPWNRSFWPRAISG